MKNAKAVLSVRFKSTFGEKELAELSEKRLDDFHNVPGLLEKYYVQDEGTGVRGGVYVFESRTAMTAFWNSDLAKSIPGTYGVMPETLRVEQLDVTLDLKEAVAV